MKLEVKKKGKSKEKREIKLKRLNETARCSFVAVDKQRLSPKGINLVKSFALKHRAQGKKGKNKCETTMGGTKKSEWQSLRENFLNMLVCLLALPLTPLALLVFLQRSFFFVLFLFW